MDFLAYYKIKQKKSVIVSTSTQKIYILQKDNIAEGLGRRAWGEGLGVKGLG